MKPAHTNFANDPFPGRPRILFIGVPYSTHVHAWVSLLNGAEMNVRLFGLQDGYPPASFGTPTYLTTPYPPPGLDPQTRLSLYPTPEIWQAWQPGEAEPQAAATSPEAWLASIIRTWRPHIIHTLGTDPAGYFYQRVCQQYRLSGYGVWAHWLWGGSDIELTRLDPEAAPRLARLLCDCEQILSDNLVNHLHMQAMGVPAERFAPINPVPGMGGLALDDLSVAWQGPPSTRRLIVWPKTYEGPWSKSLPVLEALRLAWHQLPPCEVIMLSVNDETRMYYHALPEEIRLNCRTFQGVSRSEALQWMCQARVVLAPSLVDGFPNSLYEAMAAGAFPIVSPLATITAIVAAERNVLFARNLYPEEIAAALVRAMTEDTLVDQAAERNMVLVRRYADRALIQPKVVQYYLDLAERAKPISAFIPEEPEPVLSPAPSGLPAPTADLNRWAAYLTRQETVLKAEGRKIEAWIRDMSERELRLGERERALEQRELRLGERERAVEQRELRLGEREKVVEQWEATLADREQSYERLLWVRIVRRLRAWLGGGS